MKTVIDMLEARLRENESALENQARRVAIAATALRERSAEYSAYMNEIDELRRAIAKLKA